MSSLKYLFFLVAITISFKVSAQVVLKEAKDAPVPIAIQPFLKVGERAEMLGLTTDIEAMLTADLIFSRVFKVLPAESFLEADVVGAIESFKVDSWRQVGAWYVVRGRVSKEGNKTHLEGLVFDVNTGKTLLNKKYTTTRDDTSILSHQFGDDIVEIVTGRKGLFSTKIAFVYEPPGTKDKQIWAMDFNGRNPEMLVSNKRTNLSPVWTVDGKEIIFTSSSYMHWHLWKTDLRGRQKQITSFPGSALGPAILPNGREMIASLSKDGNPELYLLTIDGKELKRLTKRADIDIAPSVSGDGKKLCFSSGRVGSLNIFSMDIATLASNKLTRVGTLNDSCAWNPYEDLVLFSGMDKDREFDIFAMNSRGEQMERLTYDARNNESPSWSPDGQLITFSSRRSGRDQIYIMKKDGSQAIPVELPGNASQPAWSPRLGY